MQVGKGSAREGPGSREGAPLSPPPSALKPLLALASFLTLKFCCWCGWGTVVVVAYSARLGELAAVFGGRHALGQLREEGVPLL